MSQYRGTVGQDRAAALMAAALVHAGLGALILSGFAVQVAGQSPEVLKIFEIIEPQPPVLQQERPSTPDERSAPEDEAAPANIRSKPTPIIAPPPRIVLPTPPPVNVAQVRGPEGLDRTAGAADVPGPGTGAGGQGSGFGGGGTGGSGTGSGGGEVPVRLIRNLTDRDYRQIAAGRQRSGIASLALRVLPDGSATSCKVVRSSGDTIVDGNLCRVVEQRLWFRPARDSRGRPIAQEIVYTATWQPG